MLKQSRTAPWPEKFLAWDLAGCIYLNEFSRQQAVKQFFSTISRLGDGIFWYAIMLSLPLFFGWQGLRLSLLLSGVGLLATLLYRHLKNTLVRERPYLLTKQINMRVAPLDRYSFPSGHTLHAVCFTTVLIWQLPSLALMLLPFTVLVALSRMVLGLHYPSDVICGAMIGLALGMMANSLAPMLL